jgi:hypothetical protein
MLDAAKAAQSIKDAHVGNQLRLWGHPQGGQGPLFAVQRAADYAPQIQPPRNGSGRTRRQTPISVPVYVGQGLADKLVIPSATEDNVGRLLCTQNTAVTSQSFPDVAHALAAYASLPAVLGWFAAVEAGEKPSNCYVSAPPF